MRHPLATDHPLSIPCSLRPQTFQARALMVNGLSHLNGMAFNPSSGPWTPEPGDDTIRPRLSFQRQVCPSSQPNYRFA